MPARAVAVGGGSGQLPTALRTVATTSSPETRQPMSAEPFAAAMRPASAHGCGARSMRAPAAASAAKSAAPRVRSSKIAVCPS
jgi:hypothetical protein